MGRKPRMDHADSWHHVMNRGANRQPTFFTRSDGELFERLIGVAHERTGVEVHAYCLMNNHFHLLLHCPHAGLADFVQYIASNYTRAVNERRQADGAIFRGRFHSLPITDARYQLAAARYIHRNPLDIVPAVGLDTYPWSSHGIYVGLRPRPVWLQTSHILGMVAGGSRAFHEMVTDDRCVRLAADSKHLLSFINLLVDELGTDDSARRSRVGRTVALALLDRVDEFTRLRLRRELELDPATQQRAMRRALQRVEASAELARTVREIERRIA